MISETVGELFSSKTKEPIFPDTKAKSLVARFNAGESIENLKNSFRELDNAQWEYFRNTEVGKAETDKFKESIGSMTGSLDGFKSSLLTAAKNIGIMMAVSLAVQGVIWVFDQINVTLEEQQEIVDDLSKEIESLRTEYDALNSLKNRTGDQDIRLRTLKTELDLLEKQYQKELDLLALNELEGEGNFFSNGILDNVSNSGTVNESISQTDSLQIFENNFRRDAENLQTVLNNYESALLESSKDVFGEQVLDYRGAILNTLSDVETKYLDLTEKRDAIQKHLDAGAFKNDTSKLTYYTNLLADYGVQLKEADNLITEIKETLQSSAHSALVEKFGQTQIGTLSTEQLEIAYQLDIDNITNFKDLIAAIENYNKQAREADKSAKSMASVIANLEALSDGFDGIKGIYEDVQNMDTFDFNSLITKDFTDIFGGYTVAYNNFVETIANSPNDINACKDAFNELVTEWFYGQDALVNITDETYAATVAWMKQEGIINAVEVADNALLRAKSNLFIKTHSLKEGTEDEIQALLDEASAAGFAGKHMYALASAIVTADDSTLTFEQQINAIYDIAEAAGLASAALNALITAAPADASSIDLGSWSDAVKNGTLNEWRQAQQTKQKLIGVRGAFNKWLGENSLDYKPTVKYNGAGNSSSGSGGSSSSNEKYVAEIDKYKELSDAVEGVELKITHLNQVLDHTDSIEGQIALNDKLIGLYKDEQDALTALNNARDKEISDNVAKLRDKGFQIDYDPKSDDLKIKNMEHLNDLSQKEIKDYEDLIKATEDLNDANKESAETWTELTYKIADVGKEITKLRIDQYDQYISDAEHLIELFSNRKDALGKDLPIYDKMMQQTVATWKQLVEDGYDKNKEDIQKLETAWMKFYDARLEREKELLEKQLDNHDSALDAILNLIDAQNDKLDDQIDSLKKVNEERKEALDLQKAQAALDKARNQKVRKVLRYGQGFIYEADQDAIKEAEETLADKKYESHISVLEQQKEALEELKNKWAEIPDLFDKYQNELLASEILGADWEQKILDDREDAYEDFRDAYFDLQDDIKDKSDELENHLNESYLEMVKLFEKFGQLNASPTLSANTSAGKTWYVEKDGSAPKDAQIGDIIKTKGGTYQIVAPNTPGAGYNAKTGRWNLKLDNNSADIKDGMWGTVAGTNGVTKIDPNLAVDPSQTGNKQLTSAIGKNTLSNQGIVDAANDQIDTIYEEITGLEAVSRYLNSNSAFTQEETNILMKHMGLVDANSESEDANTDAADMNTAGLNDNTSSQDQNTAATDDLTRAITNLSFAQMQADQYVAQNNMKEGVSNEKWLDYWDHVLELTEDPLWKGKFTQADINNALAQRNQYAQLVQQEQAVKDLMNGKEPTKVELSDKDKDIIKSLQASWNAAKEAGNEQGMELAHQLAEAVRNGFDISPNLATKPDYKLSDTAFTGGGSVGSGNKSKVQSDREWQLEKAKEFGASKDYINRLEKAIAIEKYGSGSKVETYTDEQGRTSTVISSANKAEENMSAAELQKRWDNGWRPTMNSIDKLDNGLENTNDSLSDNTDAMYDTGDSISDSAKTLVGSQTQLSEDMKSLETAIGNINLGSGSSYSSDSKHKNGGSDSDPTKGMSSEDRIRYNNLKTTASIAERNGNSAIKNAAKSQMADIKDKYKKKAKGGLNLPEDIYNVDDGTGTELLAEPTKGRQVKLSENSAVYTAEATERLWRFAENPATFIGNLLKGSTSSIKVIPTTTAACESVTHYHIESIQLPNVTDVPSFLKNLQTLPAHAQQYKARR